MRICSRVVQVCACDWCLYTFVFRIHVRDCMSVPVRILTHVQVQGLREEFLKSCIELAEDGLIDATSFLSDETGMMDSAKSAMGTAPYTVADQVSLVVICAFASACSAKMLKTNMRALCGHDSSVHLWSAFSVLSRALAHLPALQECNKKKMRAPFQPVTLWHGQYSLCVCL